MYRYFQRGSSNYIYLWKSKGLSDANITAPITSEYRLNRQLRYLVLKQEENLKEAF